MSSRKKSQSAHRPYPAGIPEASYPIYGKSRTSSDIMKHAAKAFKHVGEGPRGISSPSAHFSISPPHARPSASFKTPPRQLTSTSQNPAGGDCGGESIVQQLLSLSKLKKENNLTDREFAMAKWQVLGLTHKQIDGAETQGEVAIVNSLKSRGKPIRNRASGARNRASGAGAGAARQTPQSSNAALSPKEKISRIQQQHNDAVRSSPRPLYAHHYNKVYVSVPSARLGERVTVVRQNGPPSSGVVRFTGLTKFATGTWVGIELDVANGKNNGSVNGVKYFKCKTNHGLFVRPESVYSEAEVLSSGVTALKWVQEDSSEQDRRLAANPTANIEALAAEDPADAVVKIAAAHRRMEENLQRMQTQLSRASDSVSERLRSFKGHRPHAQGSGGKRRGRRRTPEREDLSIVEKLENFYRVVDPPRVAVAPILIERFGDSEEKLAVMCESLKQRYGVAPSLLPDEDTRSRRH